MPFKSRAQMRYLYAKHPEIAKRWQKEYGTPERMPYKVRGGDIEKRIAKATAPKNKKR